MKLPWQKDDKTDAAPEATPQAQEAAPQENLPKGYTPPKGRPTPKRYDQEVAKGVRRDPNNLSSAQAYQRRKDLKKTMSKEEWKEFKRKEREESRARARETQEKMASGDERYLMARDRGEVRRFARDWVDSRNFLSEWAMPAAIVMLVIMFMATFAPNVANIASIIAMVVIIGFAVEGFWMGKRVNDAARQKFPGTTETGFGLGFYTFGRATQPRKWRSPRPRVERGSKVS